MKPNMRLAFKRALEVLDECRFTCSAISLALREQGLLPEEIHPVQDMWCPFLCDAMGDAILHAFPFDAIQVGKRHSLRKELLNLAVNNKWDEMAELIRSAPKVMGWSENTL